MGEWYLGPGPHGISLVLTDPTGLLRTLCVWGLPESAQELWTELALPPFPGPCLASPYLAEVVTGNPISLSRPRSWVKPSEGCLAASLTPSTGKGGYLEERPDCSGFPGPSWCHHPLEFCQVSWHSDRGLPASCYLSHLLWVNRW